MSDDLERDLRAMLTARATDIRSVPDTVLLMSQEPEPPVNGDPDAEVLDLGLRLADIRSAARHRWPLLLAAAVVLAVAGGVLALVIGAPAVRVPVQPAHPEPQVRTVVRTACRADVSAAWTPVVSGATSTVPSITGDDVVAVTDDGGAVVETDGTSLASHFSERLGYLAPDASAVHWLGALGYRFPTTTGIHAFGLDVDVTGHTAVVTVESGGQTTTSRRVVAVDLLSGERTTLASTSRAGGTIEHQAYALDGIAYWQVGRPSSANPKRLVYRIESRPVGGGPSHTEASGGSYDLEKSALGIEWNLDDGAPVDRPAAVPPAVARHAAIDSRTGDVFDSYETDGQVYAWQTLQGDLDWYRPSTGRLVRVPYLLGLPGVAPGQASIFAVAGPLVYYQDQQGTGDRVLDVRTGADMHIPLGGTLFGRRGTFFGDPGSFGTPVPSSSGTLLRLEVSNLPAARC